MKNNDDNDQKSEHSFIESFDDFILDVDDLRFERDKDDSATNKTSSENCPNFLQLSGRVKKRESKISIIFTSYLNILQTNGIVDNNKFLATIGETNRRNLGQIISVLQFFGVVEKEKNIVKLRSKSQLNPPIKLKNLDMEIKELEDKVKSLKELLAAIKGECNDISEDKQ